jgi:hypothetical protein
MHCNDTHDRGVVDVLVDDRPFGAHTSLPAGNSEPGYTARIC